MSLTILYKVEVGLDNKGEIVFVVAGEDVWLFLVEKFEVASEEIVGKDLVEMCWGTSKSGCEGWRYIGFGCCESDEICGWKGL